MRRTGTVVPAVALLIFLTPLALPAQNGQINPRIPPPPPPETEELPPAPARTVTTPELTPAPRPAPATVELPAGTRILVRLDTPLSTRISKKGHPVSFRVTDSVQLDNNLELPPETEILGTVVEVRRPGGFGRPGTLKVQITGVRLENGTETRMTARLDSADAKQGRLSADKSRTAGAVDMAQWAIVGTLAGMQIGGGKGAGYGAAAGALAGLIIMMSRRGQDLYLEPGMPFAVMVDQPVTLAGHEVVAANESYARTRASSGSAPSDPTYSSQDNDSRVPDSRRPVLKRRPRTSP
jgi:hypothetical protein